MYPSEALLVKEMIRSREAYAARQAEVKRMRNASARQQTAVSSPWKQAWDSIVHSMKQARPLSR